VVNFNGEELLGDTLGAVRSIAHAFHEVFLIDNASSDGSVALVEREFPWVRVIQLAENRGPGAARNAGFREAATERILFIDNDVTPAADCALRLAEAIDQDPAAVIAMPRVLYRHEPELIQYDGASSHFLGVMSLEHADLPIGDAPSRIRPIDSLVSACFLIDRGRWAGESLFDEAFFIYHEDHDFGLRTRLSGGRILSVPEACCYHGDGTAGLSLRSTGHYKPVRVVGNIRNRWLILLKNYELRTLALLSPALIAYEAFQLAAVLKKGWHREWWQALRETAARWREIVTQRREIQQLRTVGDGAVLHGGAIPFAPQLASSRLERFGQGLLNRICMSYWKSVQRWL
jgi:GT2 family glycosyltransferase